MNDQDQYPQSPQQPQPQPYQPPMQAPMNGAGPIPPGMPMNQNAVPPTPPAKNNKRTFIIIGSVVIALIVLSLIGVMAMYIMEGMSKPSEKDYTELKDKIESIEDQQLEKMNNIDSGTVDPKISREEAIKKIGEIRDKMNVEMDNYLNSYQKLKTKKAIKSDSNVQKAYNKYVENIDKDYIPETKKYIEKVMESERANLNKKFLERDCANVTTTYFPSATNQAEYIEDYTKANAECKKTAEALKNDSNQYISGGARIYLDTMGTIGKFVSDYGLASERKDYNKTDSLAKEKQNIVREHNNKLSDILAWKHFNQIIQQPDMEQLITDRLDLTKAIEEGKNQAKNNQK